jgi:hypothetical protein
MYLYSKGERFFAREMAKYSNICPECGGREVTFLFTDLDNITAKEERTKTIYSKLSAFYCLHKHALWCINCNYFDYEDAFRERELTVCFPDLEDYNDVFRVQYINYLRKKFSLVHSMDIRLNELNGLNEEKLGG